MAAKPTYEQLRKRVEELEKQCARYAEVEKMLQESKERFRLLYDQTPLAYQSLDEEGRLIEVNRAWLDMLGYTRAEVIGRSVAEFLSKEWVEHFEQNFPRFKNIGEVLGVEFELRRKEGTPILVSVNGKVSYDEDGNFKQTHCILYDITERNRADRIRDQIVEDLHEKLVAEKGIVEELCNHIVELLQGKMLEEQETVELLARSGIQLDNL